MAIAMGDDTFVVGKKKKVMSDRWCRYGSDDYEITVMLVTQRSI